MATRAILRGERLEGRDVPSGLGLFAVGAGAGGGPRVQVYDASTFARTGDFFAYEPTFTGGITTAVADVNADGFPDVVVGSGVGGGPRVRVFDGRAFSPAFPDTQFSPANPPRLADFFAYEDSLRGGVQVGAGNLAGGGFAEVVAGAGVGGSPRVRVFDGAVIATRGLLFSGTALGDTVADFFAYPDSLRGGVRVAVSAQIPPFLLAGDLITAPGPGAAPEVKKFSGVQIAAQTTLFTGLRTGDVLADFFDGSKADLSGRFVSTADFTADGSQDIAVGTGAGVPAQVTVYDGSDVQLEGLAFTGLQADDKIDQFPPLAGTYAAGVSVGAAGVSFGLPAVLLYGVGGGGRAAEAFGARFALNGTTVSRVVVFDEVFDPGFQGPVGVST